MTPTEALIHRLVAIQGNDTDATFAARIGISRSAWQGLRTSAFPPGRRALGLIMTAFPQVTPEIMACLLPENASNESCSATSVAEVTV